MGKGRRTAKWATIAVIAAVAGVLVASVAGAGAQGVGNYTSSTTSSVPNTTRPNIQLKIRVALRYKRNQPVNGEIIVRARCRVAIPAQGAVVTDREFCDVTG